MGLVEDLLTNLYLITPAAYYLLSGPYENGEFTLVDLIKFAKSRGTFVVTLDVAEEFLRLVTGSGEGMQTSSGAPTGTSHEPSNSLPEPENMPDASTTPEPAEMNGIHAEPSTAVEQPVEPEIEPEPAVDAEHDEFSGEDEGAVSEELYSLSDAEAEEEPAMEPDADAESGVSQLMSYGEDVVEWNGNGGTYTTYEDLVITRNPNFHFKAAEIEDRYSIKFDVRNFKLSPPKPKNGNGKEGEILVEAYRSYFRSRLRKMRGILRENPEVGGVINIGKLSYVNPSGEVTVVGMVTEKHESRKGYVLELEDETGRVKVFIGRDREDYRKVMEIPKDAVVAVKGRYSRRMMFAERIYIPDVPKFRRTKEPLGEKVYAVLLSDLHVGSKKFCETAFEKFLEWLNGNVEDDSQAELVSRIKYMIIDGDAVDGVGIYPGQYSELAIPDIFDQYEALANLLSNVPDHITIFIGPGNHDAARTALPQPGFYEDYARPIMRLKNVVIISNPAVIDLHGREFLIYHGRGIEDVVNEIPNRSHHRPAETTVDLLRLRHLAPTFGEKVPIAPDPEDLLVIESVPDLFQTGHVHVMEHRTYNGVFVINSGTWQAQTEFQKMVNIVPTPAQVPIIDVETAKLRAVVRFDQFCEGV
ncbi:MAG: DNA-directed DNA polymerase II small subunit [Thermococci archaeon]|nr:DNA-directed DNA polymerase II small subunit [Thermococci archaeon]